MKYLSILAGATASVFLLAGQTATLAQQQTPAEQNNPTVTPEQNTSIEVNDEEIQSFASAFKVVQTIQDESRQKMVEAIEEQGLTIKEYNELLRQQQPESSDSEASNVSEEKQEQFQQADAQIEQIEQDAQADIEAAITDEGLQIERFQEIWIAVRQDPELQQQVKNYLEN